MRGLKRDIQAVFIPDIGVATYPDIHRCVACPLPVVDWLASKPENDALYMTHHYKLFTNSRS